MSDRAPACPEPIFIVGADRSGTTLLRLIVNGHPDAAIPPESWFLIPLLYRYRAGKPLGGSAVEDVVRAISTHPRFADWSLHQRDPQLDVLTSRDKFDSLAVLIDELYVAETAPATRWGDKTPEHLFHLEALVSHFPRARFLGIVRDPRDVALSLLPRRWRGRTPWAVGHYLERATRALREGQELLGDRLLTIRYEDLILDLEGVTQQICEHLALEVSSSMQQFWKTASEHIAASDRELGVHEKLHRPPARDDVARWRSVQTDEEHALTRLVESMTWSSLEGLGYEASTAGPDRRIERAARQAHKRAERRRQVRRMKRWALQRSVVRNLRNRLRR